MKLRNHLVTRIVSFVIAFAFMTNEMCYGLGIQPASVKPDAQKVIYATAQKQFAEKYPGSLDFSKSAPANIKFSGEVPLVPEMGRAISLDPEYLPKDVPPGWSKNPLLYNNSDLISAFKYFRTNEALITEGQLGIESGNWEKTGDGEINIARIEKRRYTDGTERWVLVIHEDFIKMWNDIRDNDVWFEYTFPDGKVRTVSLAWGIFYRIAKHEMAEYKKGAVPGAYRKDGKGHFDFISNEPHSDEISANAISGRYALVNDAVWMWFLGSYCYGWPAQYDNNMLKERLSGFFTNKRALELELNKEFTDLDGDANIKDRAKAIDIALLLNKEFYSGTKLNKEGIYGSQKLSQPEKIAPKNKGYKTIETIPATGNSGNKKPSAEKIFKQLRAGARVVIIQAGGKEVLGTVGSNAAGEISVTEDITRKFYIFGKASVSMGTIRPAAKDDIARIESQQGATAASDTEIRDLTEKLQRTIKDVTPEGTYWHIVLTRHLDILSRDGTRVAKGLLHRINAMIRSAPYRAQKEKLEYGAILPRLAAFVKAHKDEIAHYPESRIIHELGNVTHAASIVGIVDMVGNYDVNSLSDKQRAWAEYLILLDRYFGLREKLKDQLVGQENEAASAQSAANNTVYTTPVKEAIIGEDKSKPSSEKPTNPLSANKNCLVGRLADYGVPSVAINALWSADIKSIVALSRHTRSQLAAIVSNESVDAIERALKSNGLYLQEEKRSPVIYLSLENSVKALEEYGAPSVDVTKLFRLGVTTIGKLQKLPDWSFRQMGLSEKTIIAIRSLKEDLAQPSQETLPFMGGSMEIDIWNKHVMTADNSAEKIAYEIIITSPESLVWAIEALKNGSSANSKKINDILEAIARIVRERYYTIHATIIGKFLQALNSSSLHKEETILSNAYIMAAPGNRLFVKRTTDATAPTSKNLNQTATEPEDSTVALLKKQGGQVKIPFIQVIDTHVIRGLKDGLGSTQTLPIAESEYLYGAVNLLHATQVEIIAPDTMRLTDDMKRAVRRANNNHRSDARRSGIGKEEDIIDYKTYPNEERLKELLKTPPAEGIKRIVLTDRQFKNATEVQAYFDHNFSEISEKLRDVRLLNIKLPEDYTDSDDRKTFHQAHIIMVAVLARMIEESDSVGKLILQTILTGYVDNPQEFVDSIIRNDDSWNVSDRISYFLGKTVSLSPEFVKEFEELRLRMKTFWVAA